MLMRVDEQATVESKVQQVEVAELLINYNDLHRIILMGPNRLP